LRRELTQEYLKSILSYDPDTGDWLWLKAKSNSIKPGSAGYWITARSGKKYRRIVIDKHDYYASRLAFLYITGEMPQLCVDHINGDSEDDRWANLREASIKENTRNVGLTHNKSGLPMGVSHGTKYKFNAHIVVDGEGHYLGSFSTPEVAHIAYIEARRKYFGEYNRL
jgi:ribosomal protein S19